MSWVRNHPAEASRCITIPIAPASASPCSTARASSSSAGGATGACRTSSMAGHEWQMPQGGIDLGEQPHAAALRELREETNVSTVSLLAEAPHWLSYDLPTDCDDADLEGPLQGADAEVVRLPLRGRRERDQHPAPGRRPQAGVRRVALGAARALPELIIPFKRRGLRGGRRRVPPSCRRDSRASGGLISSVHGC